MGTHHPTHRFLTGCEPSEGAPADGSGYASRMDTASFGVTRLREMIRGRGSREREAVVQAAKAGLAAVLALLAAQLVDGGQLFLAPYAAVLAVTSTVRRSWSGAARQAVMLVLGVLLAYAAASVIPAPPVALAILVTAGLLLGRWRRFGGDREWIAITALLLTVNGAAHHPSDLAVWIALSVLGSAVGAVVNTLVLPPLHMRDAHDAVQSLTAEIAQHLRVIAGGVRTGWNADDAAGWVATARGIRSEVRRADDAVWFGRESVRWNPRRRSIRPSDVRMAVPEAVEQVARLSERTVQLAVLLGDLADLADQPAEPGLADLLEQLAGAVQTTAERFGTEEGPAQAVADAAAQVQRGRDQEIEPAQVRATCRVTIADALADIAPRGG